MRGCQKGRNVPFRADFALSGGEKRAAPVCGGCLPGIGGAALSGELGALSGSRHRKPGGKGKLQLFLSINGLLLQQPPRLGHGRGKGNHLPGSGL